MDIHRLTLGNIGPFTGETDIDFASLTQAGLFLLEGPTGSGKSTVLDAIVFALYGSVAASAAGTDRMRSDAAAANDPSYVELVFEVDSGIFRIRRTPGYERQKKSGSGVTLQRPSVSFWRLSDPTDNAGELLSSGSHEADVEVYRAVGLTRAQFVQTVLLPQGEFATFLHATPLERQTLLQRLFGTELYESMEREFDARRRDAERDRRSAQQGLDHAITAFLTAAECAESEAESVRSAATDDLLRTIDQTVTTRRGSQEAAKATFQLADERANAARQQLHAAESRNDKRGRYLTLKKRESALAPKLREHQERRKRRDQIAAAKALIPRHDHLLEAEKEVRRLGREVPEQEAQIAQRADDAWVNDPIVAIASLKKVARNLEPIASQEKDLPDVEKKLAEATEIAEALGVSRDGTAKQLQELPETLTRASAALKAAQAASATTQHLKEQLDTAEQRFEAARSADAIVVRLAEQAKTVGSLKQDSQKAEELRHTLQRAWIDGIAGELAMELTDGTPCAVCGSTQHPVPAVAAESHPNQAQIDAAAASVDDLSDQLSVAVDQESQLKQELAVARATSGARKTSVCQQEAQEARARLDEALAQTTELPKREAKHAELGERQERLAESLAKATTDVAVQSQRVSALEEEVAQTKVKVEQAREGHESVRHRLDEIEQWTSDLQRLVTVRSELATARQLADTRQESWRQALTNSPIENDAEFIALASSVSELPELSATVDAFDTELRVVAQGLADPEFAGFEPGESAIDLGPLQTAAADQAAKSSECSAALGRAQQTSEKAKQKAEQVADELSRVATILAKTETVISLADLMSANSAQNLAKVTLPTYVLVSRFKQVLDAANTRLDTMSDGRFSIVYLEERESHGKKSGLGISILDRHTDKRRAPGDLSGGETFYTSLSLALGLADVVMQESGGVELGTLFIDEGFGSLDTETLDSVLAEIAALRRGGRAIGVVSHVDELKQRISERIEVRKKGPGTSSLRVIA